MIKTEGGFGKKKRDVTLTKLYERKKIDRKRGEYRVCLEKGRSQWT